jgi:transcriptional regulator with XRE-family HTH domain
MSSEKEPMGSVQTVLGKKLKLFCDGAGGVKQIAEAIGIKPQQLQKYVRGAQKPGSDVLAGLKSQGCNISWLVDDQEPIGFQHESLITSQSARKTGAFSRLAVGAAQRILRLPIEEISAQIDSSPEEMMRWASGKAEPSFQQLAQLFNMVSIAGSARCGDFTPDANPDLLQVNYGR